MRTRHDEIDVRIRVEDRLLFDLLIDWCGTFAREEGFVFSRAFCSNDGTMRLSSGSLERAFPLVDAKKGALHNGHLAFYEISRGEDNKWTASLVVSHANLGKKEKLIATNIMNAIEDDESLTHSDKPGLLEIKHWDIGASENVNDVIDLIDRFARSELLFFDRELAGFLAGKRSRLRNLPDSEKRIFDLSELPDSVFAEGAQVVILSDRFERSKAARARCIAEHGAKCAICGFDFGKVYGDDFSGKIEVHHIVPLSEIREDYIVDPVNDLIPVCSNCHLILHSKAVNYAYTPDEVRAMINRGESASAKR